MNTNVILTQGKRVVHCGNVIYITCNNSTDKVEYPSASVAARHFQEVKRYAKA